MNDDLAIYQTENGGLEISIDSNKDTIWATQAQMCILFDKDQSVISRHLKNVFKSDELDEKSNMQKMHIPNSDKPVIFYNLDVILSVGYRVNSVNATKFRRWATGILHKHIVDGYTINEKVIRNNYNNFIDTIQNMKALLPYNNKISNDDILELIKTYANTWFSLEAYDNDNLENSGKTKDFIEVNIDDLLTALKNLKKDLINKHEATDLFATERQKGSVEGIFNNIMQSFYGTDLYQTVEEKASNLLYFMVKNHPFIDGNKRSGAYSFVWFLQKNKILNLNRITPNVLTILTLLIAESNPKDKDKMIKLILQLLK